MIFEYVNYPLYSKQAFELAKWYYEVKDTDIDRASKLFKMIEKYEKLYEDKVCAKDPYYGIRGRCFNLFSLLEKERNY